jgi:hypothetical protein
MQMVRINERPGTCRRASSGLTRIVAWSDLLRCGIVSMLKGHHVRAAVRLDQEIGTSFRR